MSRFGDSDFFSGGEDEYNNFDYEEGEDYASEEQSGMIGAAIPAELMDRWKQSEVNLESQKINFIVLRQAVKMLEKSWFWRFRPLATRVRMISDAYYAMLDLITPHD
jgi:hypothetical protein